MGCCPPLLRQDTALPLASPTVRCPIRPHRAMQRARPKERTSRDIGHRVWVSLPASHEMFDYTRYSSPAQESGRAHGIRVCVRAPAHQHKAGAATLMPFQAAAHLMATLCWDRPLADSRLARSAAQAHSTLGQEPFALRQPFALKRGQSSRSTIGSAHRARGQDENWPGVARPAARTPSTADLAALTRMIREPPSRRPPFDLRRLPKRYYMAEGCTDAWPSTSVDRRAQTRTMTRTECWAP
jgi:hypothetical protein